MKDLRNMSVKEIMTQLNIYFLYNDFYYFIKDKSIAEQMLKEFCDIIDSNNYSNDSINLFEKYEQYIDKESLVLIELFRMKSTDLNNIDINIKNFDKEIELAKKMLKGSRKTVVISDITGKPIIINIDILDKKQKSDKNLKRLIEITKKIPLDIIIKGLDMVDFEKILCPNLSFGEAFADYVNYNTIKNMKDIEVINAEELLKDQEFKEKNNKELEKAIFDYSEYINIDKMLLIYIYRYLNSLDNGLYSKEFVDTVQALLSDSLSFIDKNTKIKSEVRLEDENYNLKTVNISISAKDIKSKLKYNFLDGVYYGDRKIEKIRKEILEEESLLECYSPYVICLLEFEDNEILKLLDNDDNFKYVIDFEFFDVETLKNILLDKPNLSADMYEYLLNKGIIDKQFILDLYAYGNISLDTLSNLKKKEDLHIEEIAEEEELIRLYRAFTRHDKNKQEFNEYLELYKELKVKDNDIEMRKENGNRLIENLGEIFDEEDLKTMYSFGMIPVDTAIEWGGESITQDMFNNGILKPIDAKRLYKSNALTLDMIKQVLRLEELSDGDKMALICSTFDSDEDIDIRMELIQYIYLDEENKKSSSKGKRKTGVKSDDEGTIKSKNEYITDPCSRWKLISLIDEDYSQEICKDGYIIFKLPNFKNGTVVVEKIFKKYQGMNIPSYGNATYILSEEEFNKNEGYILEKNSNGDKTVSLGNLAELKENGKADKLNHSSKWGNNIKKYFEIGKDSIYSKEQIDQIDRTIKSIENSRELR